VSHPHETYQLWYDPVGHNHQLLDQVLLTLKSVPQEISPTKVERLNMLFQAQVAGQPCIALLDTGATNNFITERQVEQAGLKVVKDTSTVWGAGHTKLSTKGTVTLPLRVGQFKTRITATVVETIVPGVEVVLGQAFQSYTKAIIDCGKNKTTLHHPCGRSCSIYPINHTVNTMCILMEQAQQSAGPMAADIISAKAATKHLKRGAPYLLLHLTDTTPDTRIAGSNPSKLQAPVIGIAGHNLRTDHPDSNLETQKSGHTTGRVEKGLSHPKNFLEEATAPSNSVAAGHNSQNYTYSPPPAFQPLLNKHEAVFPADLPYGIPPDRDTGEAIPLLEHDKIPFRRNKRFTPQETQLCTEMVSGLVSKGLVTPSKSPFGAPILFIPKKKGGYRVCCDWRDLNAITKTIKFPIPRIDETLDHLSGANFFSSIDLNSGYFQIRLDPKECERTAFSTPQGHFEFKVLGQGLKNAPAIFQSMMNRILQPYLNQFVVVYLDDILIYSKTEEEHLKHIDLVLEILKKNKLYANKEKCQFFKTEVEFLGNIVGRGTIRMDPSKISTVTQWPTPSTVTEVRSFLGLCNHFRKFIKDFESIASPLYTLTKGKKTAPLKSVWTTVHNTAFQALKTALTSQPVLRHVNISEPFELVSDASLVGTGAVLLQEGQPVAYTSKKFSSAEKNYTTTEQEMLGVVRALQDWRHYFGCSDLTVVTDHNPLTHFSKGNNQLTGRLARWHQ